MAADIIELSDKNYNFDVLVILTNRSVRVDLIKMHERLCKIYKRPVKIIIDSMLLYGKDKRFRVAYYEYRNGYIPVTKIGDIGKIQGKSVPDICKISCDYIRENYYHIFSNLSIQERDMISKGYYIV